MDELTIAKMRDMRESGMSYQSIGEYIGCSGVTVRYHLNDAERKRRSEWSKEHWKNNKEYIRNRRKEHDSNNKERIKERNLKYYNDNKQKIREHHIKYYTSHKEIFREWSKKYYENNRENILKVSKKYYIKTVPITNKRLNTRI